MRKYPHFLALFILVFVLAGLTPAVRAQVSGPANRVLTVTPAPSGACSYGSVRINGSSFYICSDGGAWVTFVGGGGGTVTDVSVVTANGVSGSVATSTTTPAITLTLGAITPTTVNGLTVTTTTGTFTLTNGKTFSVAKSLTLDGTDGTTMTFPTTSASVARTDAGQTFTGTQAFGAITASGTIVQTSTSATAFESGANGSTNPVLRLVNSIASQATGISVTGRAAAAGVDITVLSSGTDESLKLVPKGAGQVELPAGTAAAPSIRFTGGNVGTGMFLGGGAVTVTASGNLVWLAGSSEMRLTSTVGLGWSTGITTTGNDTGWARSAAAVIRATNGSTGAGSLVLGTSTVGSVGTSGVGVLVVANGTAPSSSPADEWQGYSADWNGAGTAAPHFRTEDGTIYRLGGTALSTSTAAVADIGTSSLGWRQLFIDQTITAGGTTGNQTINKAAGTVNVAATGTAVTVTSNKVTTSSLVFAVARTNDATCDVKNVVPAAGSFTINLTAACTAETSFGWWVLNQ